MADATVTSGIYRETAANAVQEVFQTMLGVDTRPRDTEPFIKPDDAVVGAVHIGGQWNGALLLEIEREQACALTSRLMSIDTPASVDDDVRDAIGEITNMIAGHLKPLLPPGSVLSNPSVAEGRNSPSKEAGGSEAVRLSFDSDEGPFMLQLVHALGESDQSELDGADRTK